MTFAKWSLLLFAGLVFAPPVSAQGIQNMDMYFLAGPRRMPSQPIPGSNATLEGRTAFVYLFGYGYQVARFSAASLWIEVAPAAYNSGILDASMRGSGNSYFFVLVPTARLMVPVTSRLSIYGAAGYGAGRFYYPVIAGDTNPYVASNSTWHGVFAYGAGADYRLSRRFSVRAEVRDYVSGRGLSGSVGRHHAIPLAGVAFHF